MCEKISEPFPYTIDRASVYLHALPELSGEMCDELLYGTRLRTVGEKYTSDTGSIWYRCETEYGYCGFLQEKYLVSGAPENPEPLYPFVFGAGTATTIRSRPAKSFRPVTKL